MIQQTTIAGQTVWLLTAPPSNEGGYSVGIEMPTETERGLTGQEHRRQMASRGRVSMSWGCVLSDSDIRKLRTALQANQGARFAVPFWPGLTQEPEDLYPFAAAYYAVETSGVWSVVESGSRPLTLPDGDSVAPLLIGVLRSMPEPLFSSPGWADVSFDFAEDSRLSWIEAAPETFEVGPAAASGNPPLFPFRPDWGESPRTGGSITEVVRENIGFQRESSQAFYPSSASRIVDLSFVIQGPAEVARLFAFWAERGGGVRACWVPSALRESRLLSSVASSDTTLSVESVADLGGTRHLLLDDNTKRRPVVATAAANPIPLASPVGADFDRRWATLWSLLLVRQVESKLSLQFTDRQWATLKIRFAEVPAEYSAGVGETAGVTLGASPAEAHLYRLTVLAPTPEVFRYTSHEFPLTDGTDTWTPENIEHGQISESLNLQAPAVSLRSRVTPSNPLARLIGLRLEHRLRVEIIAATLTGFGSIADLPPVYVRHLVTGLYHEVVANTLGVVVMAINPVGIAGSFPPTYVRNTATGLYHEVTANTVGPAVTLAINPAGISGTYSPVYLRHIVSTLYHELTANTLAGVVVLSINPSSSLPPGTPKRRLFFGEVRKGTYDGPYVNAECVAAGGIGQSELLRITAGHGCSATVYDSLCGVLASDYQVAAVVDASVTNSNTVTIKSGGTAWASGLYPAHHFAGGLLTLGSGSSTVHRVIADSGATDGSGKVLLTLGLAVTAAANAAVVALPGCNGSISRCKQFNVDGQGGKRFRGFPFTPIQAPQQVKSAGDVRGGKK